MQPQSGVQPVRVQGTAASTTVIRDHSCLLHNITMAGSLSGTIAIYNSNSVAPAAGDLLGSFPEGLTNALPTTLNLGWEMNKGCVVVATGEHEVVLGLG